MCKYIHGYMHTFVCAYFSHIYIHIYDKRCMRTYIYVCISAQARVWRAYVVLAHEYATRHIHNRHCADMAWYFKIRNIH